MITFQKALEWAILKVRGAQDDKLFGSINIQFENGVITRIKTEKIEQSPKA